MAGGGEAEGPRDKPGADGYGGGQVGTEPQGTPLAIAIAILARKASLTLCQLTRPITSSTRRARLNRGALVFLTGAMTLAILLLTRQSPSFIDIAEECGIAESCCAVGATVLKTKPRENHDHGDGDGDGHSHGTSEGSPAGPSDVFIMSRLAYNRLFLSESRSLTEKSAAGAGSDDNTPSVPFTYTSPEPWEWAPSGTDYEHTTSASAADLDNDGGVDLYISSRPQSKLVGWVEYKLYVVWSSVVLVMYGRVTKVTVRSITHAPHPYILHLTPSRPHALTPSRPHALTPSRPRSISRRALNSAMLMSPRSRVLNFSDGSSRRRA